MTAFYQSPFALNRFTIEMLLLLAAVFAECRVS
jgi:hypothetical protein